MWVSETPTQHSPWHGHPHEQEQRVGEDTVDVEPLSCEQLHQSRLATGREDVTREFDIHVDQEIHEICHMKRWELPLPFTKHLNFLFYLLAALNLHVDIFCGFNTHLTHPRPSDTICKSNHQRALSSLQGHSKSC